MEISSFDTLEYQTLKKKTKKIGIDMIFCISYYPSSDDIFYEL